MSEKRKPPFLNFINFVLTKIDGVLEVLGIWKDIVFIYLIPAVAMYFPVQYFIIGNLLKNDPYFSQALIYLIDIGAIALLCGLIFIQKTVASFVEVAVCTLFLLDGWLKLISISGEVYIGYMYVGIGISLFLIFIKIISGIYLLMKSYRRKYMKKHRRRSGKRFAEMVKEERWILESEKPDGDSEEKDLSQNKDKKSSDNEESKKSTKLDQTGFIVEVIKKKH